MMKCGRPLNPNRKARIRYASLLPVGTLSMFRNLREVGRSRTSEMPAATEIDPVVYLARPNNRGPRTPADLFYLVRESSSCAVRVYVKEVITDAE